MISFGCMAAADKVPHLIWFLSSLRYGSYELPLMVQPVGYISWQARKSDMSPPHFWASVLDIGPVGVPGAVVFPPGNTALPNSAIASGIAGPTVRTALTAVLDLVRRVVVTAVPFEVVVSFGFGIAKPHLHTANRPGARPVQRSKFRRLGLVSRGLLGLGRRLLRAGRVGCGLISSCLRGDDGIIHIAAVRGFPDGALHHALRLAVR